MIHIDHCRYLDAVGDCKIAVRVRDIPVRYARVFRAIIRFERQRNRAREDDNEFGRFAHNLQI